MKGIPSANSPNSVNFLSGDFKNSDSNFTYSKGIYDIELHDSEEYDYSSLSNYIVVAIETDGICPGLYSMIGIAAVSVRDKTKYFYENIKPITNNYHSDTLERLGLTREMTLAYKSPEEVIPKFCDWLKDLYVDKPIIVSDNPAFVFHFVLYYCILYNNGIFPFTFIPRSISDIYSGLLSDLRLSGAWRHWTKIERDFTCLSEAKRVAEAFRVMIKRYSLKESKPFLKISKNAMRPAAYQLLHHQKDKYHNDKKIKKYNYNSDSLFKDKNGKDDSV